MVRFEHIALWRRLRFWLWFLVVADGVCIGANVYFRNRVTALCMGVVVVVALASLAYGEYVERRYFGRYRR